MKPYLKNTHPNRPGGVAQVVKHLSIKHEALSSSSSTAKRNKLMYHNQVVFIPEIQDGNAISKIVWY
jgi:hypothetical protein